MTIYELMQLLEKHPPDLRVMVNGYEDGYGDLSPDCIMTRDVRLNVYTKWYAGRHDEAYEGNQNRGSGTAKALILHRPSHDDDEEEV